jgi:hypothetical protein
MVPQASAKVQIAVAQTAARRRNPGHGKELSSYALEDYGEVRHVMARF